MCIRDRAGPDSDAGDHYLQGKDEVYHERGLRLPSVRKGSLCRGRRDKIGAGYRPPDRVRLYPGILFLQASGVGRNASGFGVAEKRRYSELEIGKWKVRGYEPQI